MGTGTRRWRPPARCPASPGWRRPTPPPAAAIDVIAVASSAPDISTLKPVDKGQNSEVFASNGQRLGFIENDELRQQVATAQLPTALRNATIAIEDQRFYKHKGVDYEGVV